MRAIYFEIIPALSGLKPRERMCAPCWSRYTIGGTAGKLQLRQSHAFCFRDVGVFAVLEPLDIMALVEAIGMNTLLSKTTQQPAWR